MALVDRALRAGEPGEARTSPTQDEEFVLSHSDNVEASGFVGHHVLASLWFGVVGIMRRRSS